MSDWAGNPRDMMQELTAKSGLPVVCAMLTGPVIGVEFRVIDGAKPWRKAFVLELGIATPQAFLAMLEGWRAEMRKRIDASQVPGTLLGAVIAEHGLPAVREALEPRKGVLH